MTEIQTENTVETPGEKSFFGIIVHSFFIIPFLIAVFCVLLFTAVHLLTREQVTAFDLLNDVKTGGLTKRWQAAFELSKVLANPKLYPQDERFTVELNKAFHESQHDDPRVRQYLALAMGRTGQAQFFPTLTAEIQTEKEENLPAIIYALGMLKDARAVPVLTPYLDSQSARIRSFTVVALGTIADPSIKNLLKKTLNDSEPNVQWGSAIALAKQGDASGKEVLLQLLNRSYFTQFSEVDSQEQNQLILSAIDASSQLNDADLQQSIQSLAQTDKNMNVRAAAMKAVAQSTNK